MFSKILERFLHNWITSFSNQIFSDFICAYRKGCSTNLVLIRLNENRKTMVDKNLLLEQVWWTYLKYLTVLNTTYSLLNSYLQTEFRHSNFSKFILKSQQQNVGINNIFSAFQNIRSGAPQGSIFGLILSNIFLYDLFLYIKKSDLHNFAGNNIITVTCYTLAGLLKTLEQESESVLNWFKQNKIIVNADKFQVIILNKKESEATYRL